MRKVYLFSFLFLLSFSTHGYAQDTQDLTDLSLEALMSIRFTESGFMDIHHVHPKGEWMISYKYGQVLMRGNRDRASRQSNGEVLRPFMVTPTEMTMGMHMSGIMFGTTDRLTLMGMISYRDLSMDHLTRLGASFTAEAKGIGDLNISGLYAVQKNDTQQTILTFGLSIPTGSINRKDDLPSGPDQRLPYPMQLRSGTLDPFVSATYIRLLDNSFTGGYVKRFFRSAENKNNYRSGNGILATGWYSYIWNEVLSFPIRFDGQIWNNIKGAEPVLNPGLVPTAVPHLRGGKRINVGIGISAYIPKGAL